MPVFKKVNKDFFKKWTLEMAYVLGFFAADGNIMINKRGGQFWSIEIKDKELLKNIKNSIGSEHKISLRIKNNKEKGIKYKTYRLQIGSIEMCNDLKKLGFKADKTNSLAVPNVPTKYLSDFVRGYFDGDGNVWVGLMHKGRNVWTLSIQTAFTSCSLRFLENFNTRIIKSGINKGAIYTREGRYSRLVYSTHGSLKLYDFMYNNLDSSKLFLKRKKVVFENYIKKKS